jgi:tetratricopeptide (TPR) repeat protein
MEERGTMTNKQVLLQRAEEQFLKSDYDNALKIYSILLQDHPQLKDAKIGVFLSDMGMESDEDAQALFDYYQAIKDSNEDADKLIDELMQAIYATRVVIQEKLLGTLEEVALEEGIRYSDFISLIEEKGSFKEAFEDIMFSTRVVIRTREEFIDFIRRLVEAGYQEMALGYLDSLAESFGPDQEIYALYNLVRESKQ